MRILTKRLVAMVLALTILMGCISVANAENAEYIEFECERTLVKILEDKSVLSLYNIRSNREMLVATTACDIVLNAETIDIEENVVEITADALAADKVYVQKIDSELLIILFFSEDYLLTVPYTLDMEKASCALYPFEDAASMSEMFMAISSDEYEHVDRDTVLSLISDIWKL